MYQINQYVMHYKNGLSKIIDIAYNQDLLDKAYKLESIDGVIDYVKVNSKEKKIRELIKSDDLEALKLRMDKICDRMIKNKKEREMYYANLSLFGSFEDLVIIAKRYYYYLKLYHFSYLSAKEREVFEFTKKKLFQEVSYVASIPYEMAEEYLFGKKDEEIDLDF